jgi:hypothetical protein
MNTIFYNENSFKEQSFTFDDGVKITRMWVSPEMAKDWLETKNDENRELKKRFAKHYQFTMEKGQWRLTHQGIAFNDRDKMQDGQTRMEAIVASGRGQWFYVFENMPSENFAALDSGNLRSTGDALFVSGIKEHETLLGGMISYMLKNTGDAIYQSSLSTARITHQDVLEFVEKNPRTLEVAKIIDNEYKVGKFIVKSAIAAYYYWFSEINPAKAKEFFDMFYTGANLPVNHPVWHLRNIEDLNARARKKLSVGDRTGIFIKAWNYFIQGKNTISSQSLNFHIKKDVFPLIKKEDGTDLAASKDTASLTPVSAIDINKRRSKAKAKRTKHVPQRKAVKREAFFD